MTDGKRTRPGRWRRAPGRWGRAVVLLVVLVIVGGFALAFALRTTAQAEAMIQFNHRRHIAAGVPCLFCHPSALHEPVASIPSLQKCVGCHQNIQVTSETGQATVDQVLQVWAEGGSLRWPKIMDLPDFVAFNHRPHLAAGKNCENCHGDVSQMTMARKAFRINMGFCLENCHRHQDAEKRERLMDCATCHQ